MAGLQQQRQQQIMQKPAMPSRIRSCSHLHLTARTAGCPQQLAMAHGLHLTRPHANQGLTILLRAGVAAAGVPAAAAALLAGGAAAVAVAALHAGDAAAVAVAALLAGDAAAVAAAAPLAGDAAGKMAEDSVAGHLAAGEGTAAAGAQEDHAGEAALIMA